MTGKSLHDTIWADGPPYLMEAAGLTRYDAGGMIQGWLKKYDPGHLRIVLSRAIKNQPYEPRSYIISGLERLRKEQPTDIKNMDNQRLQSKIAHLEKFCATRAPGNHCHVLLRELRDEAGRRELL